MLHLLWLLILQAGIRLNEAKLFRKRTRQRANSVSPKSPEFPLNSDNINIQLRRYGSILTYKPAVLAFWTYLKAKSESSNSDCHLSNSWRNPNLHSTTQSFPPFVILKQLRTNPRRFLTLWCQNLIMFPTEATPLERTDFLGVYIEKSFAKQFFFCDVILSVFFPVDWKITFALPVCGA